MRWAFRLVLFTLIAGCLWRGYDRVLTIHLDVLAGIAAKMVAISEAGRRPTSNDITEMLYPLERGRVFLHQFEGRRERESYRQFAQLLDQYGALAAAIDNARTDDGRWAALQQHLPADAHALQERVAAVRAAVEAGT